MMLGLQKVFGCYKFEEIFRGMSNTIKNHYMHAGCQKNDSAISRGTDKHIKLKLSRYFKG